MTRFILSITFFLHSFFCSAQTSVEFHLANAHGDMVTKAGEKYEIMQMADKNAQQIYETLMHNISEQYTDSSSLELSAAANERILLKAAFNINAFGKKAKSKEEVWAVYEFTIRDNKIIVSAPKLASSRYGGASFLFKDKAAIWMKNEKSQKKYSTEIKKLDEYINNSINNILHNLK